MFVCALVATLASPIAVLSDRVLGRAPATGRAGDPSIFHGLLEELFAACPLRADELGRGWGIGRARWTFARLTWPQTAALRLSSR